MNTKQKSKILGLDIDEFLLVAAQHMSENYSSTLTECARKISVSTATLSRMFSKERPPPLELLADMGYEMKNETTFILTKTQEINNGKTDD